MQEASSLLSLYWLKQILERGNNGIILRGNKLIVDLRFLSSLSSHYEVKRRLIAAIEFLRHTYSVLLSCDTRIDNIIVKLQRNKKYDTFINLLLTSTFSLEEKRELVKREYQY